MKAIKVMRTADLFTKIEILLMIRSRARYMVREHETVKLISDEIS